MSKHSKGKRAWLSRPCGRAHAARQLALGVCSISILGAAVGWTDGQGGGNTTRKSPPAAIRAISWFPANPFPFNHKNAIARMPPGQQTIPIS